MPTNPASIHSTDEAPSDAANLKISLQSPDGLDVTASSEMRGPHLGRFWDAVITVAAMAAATIVPLLNAKDLAMLPAHLTIVVMAIPAVTALSIFALWRSRRS
ncbi:hypothetical protein [Streptosporangium carneum]|uniref:Uncharacterized protein n=1 Tax=Streptosporangium carneum TaxID=47481 RepID=A0A9W6HVT9_9ACTN|nr:hypothetical protein [Streptosporangium carneum]GLK06711.1 hypothetical protein GCM10017600_01160 [Streptosporangium carneum]